ncbi:MAG: ferrous iron transport protein B [Anaerolineae bacterium]
MTCPRCDTPQAAAVEARPLSTLTVALAGNPNAGKTTLFNALTGARQHVGNWPGKTVERKEGRFSIGELDVTLVDLPGTYSLSAFSAEEIITMDYLIDERPDLVVLVVDAGNLERNLYLTMQVLEIGLPAIVVLNMMDAARARGIEIDTAGLSAGLGGVPVIPASAARGEGLGALQAAIEAAARQIAWAAGEGSPAPPIDYGPAAEHIARLEALIRAHERLPLHCHPRWLALKLLEADPHITARVEALPGAVELLRTAEAGAAALERATGDDRDTFIADRRYAAINALVRRVTTRPPTAQRSLSDRIDRVVTHPLLGLPVFAAVMWLVFQLTANVATPYIDWIDGVFGGPLTGWTLGLTGLLGLGGSWVESLLVDGVIAGVGGVMVFIPVLMFMYMFLTALEDSGYMARAAFMADRFLHVIGLHGKSFIPMLLGFGCNVPGIFATRTLDNPRDRILTGLLIPFMSCGARLPVYVIIGAAFFGRKAGALVFALYFTGVIVAVLVGLLLRSTVLRSEEETPFLIELPPYRMPSLKNVWLHAWEHTRAFIRNAWTIVLAVSVAVWFLLAVPVGAPGEARFAQVEPSNSALAAVSGAVAPAFEPAGFGTWQASSALVTGFVAKELVIATLSTVYVGPQPEEGAVRMSLLGGLGEIARSFVAATWDTLRTLADLIPGVNPFGPGEGGDVDAALAAALRASFTPLSAVAYCVFVLLTVPCMVTVSALRQEFGAKWTVFSIALTLVVSWTAAVLVYQGGLLLGLGVG